MKVIFVNAFKTKNPFNWIVALWTKGKYSHCEFLFRDGTMFGASFTDGRCRFKRYVPCDQDEVFTINVSIKEENEIRSLCGKFQGKRYDYMGLMGFVFNSDDFEHKGKYFCSELMTYLLERVTLFKASKEPCRMSPNKLYKDLRNSL